MITVEGILENLKEMVGKEMDADDIICAFEDFEEFGETEVLIEKSGSNDSVYSAYINAENSTEFCISLEKIWKKCYDGDGTEVGSEVEKEIIDNVWIA